jgi:beta-phosphoglucomutase-like phosphatase (HAD superfamily)
VSALQAVLVGWSGVVADDERIQAEIIRQLLIQDNLRPLEDKDWHRYRLIFAGQPDVERLRFLWHERGRVLDQGSLAHLLERKQDLYLQQLSRLDRLPLTGGIRDLLNTLEKLTLRWILVAGTSEAEVMGLLTKTGLIQRFPLMVTGDDITGINVVTQGLPLTDGLLHQIALQKLGLPFSVCLGIEATYAGILSGLSADLEMIGIPTVIPMHMLQRRVDWVFDGPDQIDWPRLLYWRQQGEDRHP